MGLLLLAGCGGEEVPYNSELFQANKGNPCWPCLMYMQAFKSIDRVLDGSLDKISQNSLVVLELALIFWLLFRVMRLVVSFSMPDLKKELATFATVLFKAMIVAIFLHHPTYLYDFFGKVLIQPLGDGFVSLANTVLQTPSQVGIPFNYTETGFKFLDEFLETLHGASPNELASTSKMFGELAVTIQTIIYQIYDALWKNIGLGFQLWTTKGFSAILAGFILIAGMLWLMIMIPLSFVDAFVRIGMILILLPLLMVAWVFSHIKDIQGIINKQFKNLFAGFFDILFNCIYITFLVCTFRVYESQEMPFMSSSSYQTTEGGMRVIGSQFGTEFVILTMLAWTMVKLAGKVQAFSGYFFASAGKSSVFGMIDKLKGWATKGVRIGTEILSGPVGWAKGAAEAASKEIQQEEQKESNKPDEKEKSDDKNQKDDSQKPSKKNSAPKPKEGKK